MSVGFGVYVHVPYCAHRCDYCSFVTFTDRDHTMADYMAAMRTQIEREVAAGMPVATSVFVGGGTPSRVDPDSLVHVLSAIPLAPGAEVTVEANPDDVTAELVARWQAGGVNRVSLGVQSTVPHVLASLGRTHDPAGVRAAVGVLAAAGLESFSLDLIYGAAGESLDDWRTSLADSLALDPPHVSAYALTIEPGTALAAEPHRHPDDDDQAAKYELADEMLAAGGLANYEISNWSRPGHESRHNLLYWRQGDYAAIGAAAHGHRDGRRFWNVRTPERYVELVAAGQSPVSADETLDPEVRALESLQLSIRTRDGVPESAFSADDLDDLAPLLHRAAGRVSLTRAGRLLANEVSLRLKPS